MHLGIEGRKAIVCASSRGLGLGTAKALAEAGCDLVINGRNEQRLDQIASELAAQHSISVIPVAADISSPEGQQAVLKACPNPDILVNNNGGPPRKDFKELDRQAIQDGVIQNMITPIELIKAVIDGMAERRFGRIVNITSMSVKMPIEGLDLSSGARAGLTAFLAGVCRQYAQHNVTINNVLPGKFDTDRLKGGFERQAEQTGISIEEAKRLSSEEIPARRLGNPEEFGKACAFMCSAHAGYITGQNLLLDGGLYPSAF
ncbi:MULTISPECIES: SDR family oxidoreductase [unclassified Pseudovibrio]|uniref:SDR family oxidoreductase n=1 Tax=unclassified Pseudovibrio TaxID=2627060 RepID=UPI0007AE77E1|nr:MULTISPECIES: SDR family oxidoreductase [unclassified Pseudovibrio]KZK93230.1 3-oxoacyl-[acyl-carrier-protein] reductase FabG [Pseudovibrio sp. W74]KZL07121.1 3-oxoacyl-[acyl-carrier-protein] reductase FabG [Pseudovibrio sp. Ad14]KZL23167.1 3-oxoacyl-[acyl-carrier-protein] reductase FabG [Pseudovibrio sp. WM33]